jgi:hypothetical protein
LTSSWRTRRWRSTCPRRTWRTRCPPRAPPYIATILSHSDRCPFSLCERRCSILWLPLVIPFVTLIIIKIFVWLSLIAAARYHHHGVAHLCNIHTTFSFVGFYLTVMSCLFCRCHQYITVQCSAVHACTEQYGSSRSSNPLALVHTRDERNRMASNRIESNRCRRVVANHPVLTVDCVCVFVRL